MNELLQPNTKVSNTTFWSTACGIGTVFLILWVLLKPIVFPSPLEVLAALPQLWADGLWDDLMSSFLVNVEALILSTAIGLPLAYLSRVPVMAPLSMGVAKLRFVGPVVFFTPLVFMTSSGHELKVLLLTFGELFYLLTTMIGVVGNIPEYKFDDARTLRMSEWLSIWYVVIRGTVAEAIDAVRDNSAMGWAMLMFVEGVVRSEGGVGLLIVNMDKHVNFAQSWAISLIILAVGMAQDWLIGWGKKVVCPYV